MIKLLEEFVPAEILSKMRLILTSILRPPIITDKIILSPGNEYVDFALEIGKAADIFEDEDDYNETINYFKLFKSVE